MIIKFLIAKNEGFYRFRNKVFWWLCKHLFNYKAGQIAPFYLRVIWAFFFPLTWLRNFLNPGCFDVRTHCYVINSRKYSSMFFQGLKSPSMIKIEDPYEGSDMVNMTFHPGNERDFVKKYLKENVCYSDSGKRQKWNIKK